MLDLHDAVYDDIANTELSLSDIADKHGTYYQYVYGVKKKLDRLGADKRRESWPSRRVRKKRTTFLYACGLFSCIRCGVVKSTSEVSGSCSTWCRECRNKYERDRRRELKENGSNTHKPSVRTVTPEAYGGQVGLRKKHRDKLRKVLQCEYSHSCREYFGCDLETLRAHIESLFYGDMTWENRGFDTWHIDHIIPLSKFDLTDEFECKMANYYKNLRPLTAKENMTKSAGL